VGEAECDMAADIVWPVQRLRWQSCIQLVRFGVSPLGTEI